MRLSHPTGNPYIKDKLTRLAEDGSKKMLNTLKDAVLELHEKGLPTTIISLANAAWIRFMTGESENGEAILGVRQKRVV